MDDTLREKWSLRKNHSWWIIDNPSAQVGRQWIVTAAHCVEAGGDGQFTVVAGSIHRIEFSVHQQVGFFVFHIRFTPVFHICFHLFIYASVNISTAVPGLFLLAYHIASHICMCRREWSIWSSSIPSTNTTNLATISHFSGDLIGSCNRLECWLIRYFYSGGMPLASNMDWENGAV